MSRMGHGRAGVSRAVDGRFRVLPLDLGAANGRNRRIHPVPARSGGGRLTERTPAVPPGRRERVKVPQSRPSR